MTVKEFIDDYKKIPTHNQKAIKDFLNARIVNNYVSYENKISTCERIINLSCYKNNMFFNNSPLRYVLFTVAIIQAYTDIIFDEDVMKGFNLLNESDLITAISQSVPQKEYVEFKTILDMSVDDIMMNERNIVGYVDNLLYKFFEYISEIQKETENKIES